MRNQMLRRAILQLLYERALEAPQSLIVGIEAREIVLQLGMTNKEGLITNDRASNGGELQFNAIMLTPAGIDAIENPTDFDRLVPLTEDTGAHNHRLKSHP